MRIRSMLLLATFTAACGGGGDGGTGPATVASVAISPSADITTFTPGSKIGLTATVMDASGAAVTSPTTWSTTDATVLSLSATSGLASTVTALTTGAAKVIATSGGKADTVNVTVVAQVFSAVKVSPLSMSITSGATTTLSATPVDQNGVVMTGSGFGSPTFVSSNVAVATVSAAGVVTGVANGTANVTASIAATGVAKSGVAVITVAAAGAFPTTAVVSADGTYGWNPPSVDIAVGGSVSFQNQTTYTHNVTFSAATGAPQGTGDFIGDTRSATFPTAGTFNYHCSIHPGMTGTVVVH
jgi:plastocyanin